MSNALIPTLIAVSGPPGAGKTTLAHALAAALGWPAVCRDEIKERLVSQSTESLDHLDLKTLDVFFQTLGETLQSGASVVAEAAYQDRLWRPGLERLPAPADIRVVRCVIDPALARERIIRRAAEDPARTAHADADLLRRIADGQRPIESWVPISLDVPTLTVGTTGTTGTTHGWDPPLDAIVGFAKA